MSNIQLESNGQAMILYCDYKKVLQGKINNVCQKIGFEPYGAFGASVHQECKKKFFLGKVERQQSLFRFTGRMNRVHFCKVFKVQRLKIKIGSVDKNRAICDLCLVAFTWFKLRFTL